MVPTCVCEYVCVWDGGLNSSKFLPQPRQPRESVKRERTRMLFTSNLSPNYLRVEEFTFWLLACILLTQAPFRLIKFTVMCVWREGEGYRSPYNDINNQINSCCWVVELSIFKGVKSANLYFNSGTRWCRRLLVYSFTNVVAAQFTSLIFSEIFPDLLFLGSVLYRDLFLIFNFNDRWKLYTVWSV